MAPKLVTVYGATGNQGGGVARALLADKTSAFSVRGITRNPDSERAKALVSVGAEVMRADGRQKEQLTAAFGGSWAVFANTQSDDPVCSSPLVPGYQGADARVPRRSGSPVGLARRISGRPSSMPRLRRG